MFKILFALAPYYLRSRHKSPAKAIAGLAMTVFLGGIAAIFFLTALFIGALQSYGAVMACLTLGTVCMAFGLLTYVLTHRRKPVHKAQTQAAHGANLEDPLMEKLPDGIKFDPRIQGILAQVSSNPLAAGTAAVTLGYVLSGEISKRT